MNKNTSNLYTGTPFEGMTPEQVQELSDQVQKNTQEAINRIGCLCNGSADTSQSYYWQVRHDAERWIEDNDWSESYSLQSFYDEGLDDFAINLYRELWTQDSITGYESGSYYPHADEAKAMILAHIEEASEAAREYEFDTNKAIIGNKWNAWDVTTRCYFVWNVCSDIAEEFEDHLIENFPQLVASGEIEPNDTAVYSKLNSLVAS